jgi:hypothetical protein
MLNGRGGRPTKCFRLAKAPHCIVTRPLRTIAFDSGILLLRDAIEPIRHMPIPL